MPRRKTLPTLTCRLDRRHPLARGLVGWWKAVADARGALWYDRSGYGGHGTLTNMSPASDWLATGDRLSLDLDGTDDYVSIPDSDRYTFADYSYAGGTWTDRPFSLCAWVRMRDATSFRLVSKTSASAVEWILGTNPSDNIGSAIYSGNSGVYLNRVSTATLTSAENVWTLIGMSYDGSMSNAGLTLYRNGRVEASTGGSSGSYAGMQNTAANVEIGRFIGSQYANGQVDDVRIYNRCLSAKEFGDIYQDSATQRYEMLQRPHERLVRANSYYVYVPTSGSRVPWPLWLQRVV